MLLQALLLSLPLLTPPSEGSLLNSVPEDAYALVHCRQAAALRLRAEGNDWYRLLGSSFGAPLYGELRRALRSRTHCDEDELLALAAALEGEVVFFDTGTVAGLLAEPADQRAALDAAMRAWLPDSGAAQRTLELGGGKVELSAWPDQLDGWSGRAGHFAAFVDHPELLALFSGDDSELVLKTVTRALTAPGNGQRAPVVAAYLEAGGGRGAGLELFVDFTPHVARAEAALKELVEDLLPDPTKLLGLEAGTWLHASADLFAGARIDCQARLHLPPDTLAASLADTFRPLPRTLPADLPKGTWSLWSLNWDLKLFYQRVRAAYEQAGLAEGLGTLDGGLEAAKSLAGIDPIEDLLNQLAGDFTWYLVDPPNPDPAGDLSGMRELRLLGFQLGLVSGDAFLTAFEQLFELGGLESVLELVELAGVEAYVMDESDGADGGLAVLPRALAAAATRSVLERSLEALTRVEDASLPFGSLMQAVIDEHAGVCFLTSVELTPLRTYALTELGGDPLLPPLQEGQAARDPFDAQLISSARRTVDGFEFHLFTR